MWNFRKPAPPCKPDPDYKRELACYKRLILDEIGALYDRICEALSVTDPHDLTTLHDVINEYKEAIAAIDAKMDTMNALNDVAIDALRREFDQKLNELRAQINK